MVLVTDKRRAMLSSFLFANSTDKGLEGSVDEKDIPMSQTFNSSTVTLTGSGHLIDEGPIKSDDVFSFGSLVLEVSSPVIDRPFVYL